MGAPPEPLPPCPPTTTPDPPDPPEPLPLVIKPMFGPIQQWHTVDRPWVLRGEKDTFEAALPSQVAQVRLAGGRGKRGG